MSEIILGLVTLAMFGYCIWQSVYYHKMISALTEKLMAKSLGEYSMVTKPVPDKPVKVDNGKPIDPILGRNY